jgi:DNA replication protein DnaC
LKITDQMDAEAQAVDAILKNLGVFPIHRRARISDFDTVPDDRPAFIYGPVGTGKTHLAVAYLADSVRRHLASDGAGIKFCRAVDLIGKLRASFRGGAGADEIIDQYCRYNLLVLDDLGTERDSPFVQEAFYSILDYRAGHLAATLITSNLSLPRIAAQYGDFGDRIASRIYGLGPVLELKGKDRRLTK